MRVSLQVIFLLIAFGPCIAQDTSLQTAETTTVCTEELFEQAESSFDRRKFGTENLFISERQLSKVIRVCKDHAVIFQAEEQLRVVHEELADYNLRIALFYLDKFYDGKGGKAGAVSRL